jgi:hypothetical protein
MTNREASSPGQQIYSLPATVSRYSLAGVVLYASLLVVAMVLLLSSGERVLDTVIFSIVLFVPLGWHCLTTWRERADSIYVSSTHISVRRANQTRLSMRRSDVVKIREHFFRRRLELVDAQRRVLRIRYELMDFARLRETIQARVPRLRDKQPPTRVFHRYSVGGWIWFVLFGLLVGFDLFAIISAEWKVALTDTVFTALLAAWAFSEVRSVRVGPREVQLQRLIGARRVRYTDIMRIDLVDAYQEGVAAGVILALSSGEEIKLQQFLGNYLEVYNAISEAWTSGGARA